MQRILRLLAAAAFALLVAVPVLAQGQSLVLVDETGNLDRSSIAAAAEPLIDRGATVAIYMVEQGGENDFEERLLADNLRNSDGRLRQGLIAIYVSTNPRNAAIRFDDMWNEALQINEHYANIIQAELIPGLSAGNFTQGYVDTLQAIDASIENPPVPAGGSIINISLVPVVIGVFVLLALGTGGYVVMRRRSAAQALEKARADSEEARQAAGTAIVEAGNLMQAAQEKSKFDRLSYGADDVQQLAQMQAQIEQRFAKVQQQFDETEHELARFENPDVSRYEQATHAYQEARQMAASLHDELEQLTARRVELDRLAAQAQEEIDRAKKS